MLLQLREQDPMTRDVLGVCTGHGERSVHHFGQEEIRTAGLARRRTQVGPARAYSSRLLSFLVGLETFPLEISQDMRMYSSPW